MVRRPEEEPQEETTDHPVVTAFDNVLDKALGRVSPEELRQQTTPQFGEEVGQLFEKGLKDREANVGRVFSEGRSQAEASIPLLRKNLPAHVADFLEEAIKNVPTGLKAKGEHWARMASGEQAPPSEKAPDKPIPDSALPGIMNSIADTLKTIKDTSESTGRLAIDPTKLLDVPGIVVDSIKRTGNSWNKALELLHQGYQPSDPEVLKYAFDIATNMLPGGIAIKEGMRVPRGTPQAASEAKVAKGVKINEEGLIEIDITKPASSKLEKGAFHAYENASGDWVVTGPGQQAGPTGTMNFGPGPQGKQWAESHLKEVQEGKPALESQAFKDAGGKPAGSLDDLGSEGYVGPAPKTPVSNFEIKEGADGFFHVFSKNPDGSLTSTGVSVATKANAEKMVSEYEAMAQKYPSMVKASPGKLSQSLGMNSEEIAKLAAQKAESDKAIAEVTKYVHQDMPKDAWYDLATWSTSKGVTKDTNFGSMLTSIVHDSPDVARAIMDAHRQDIGKLLYHDQKTGITWIIDMRPKDMKTAPKSALERRFPNATRIDTMKPEHDVPHPGPLIAFHGTSYKFQPKVTAKGPMEMEFADVSKSADIGWHFGTAEQASYRGLGKGTEGAKVIPVYLNIKTPMDMPDLGGWGPESMASVIVRNMEDRVAHRAGPVNTFYLKSAQKMLARVEDLMSPKGGYPDSSTFQQAYDQVRNWLDKHGYDSIRYLNEAEGEGWSYIVWQKGRVKSAPTPEHTLYVAPGLPKIDPRGQKEAED